ncbi:MAG: acyl-CoA dehydrogenase family protein, partial [Candidatus Hinthialibacter sp.]
MANYYTDNPDIQLALRQIDWSEIIQLKEQNFSDAGRYPDAPSSVEEALQNYESILELSGEIAADYIEPRASSVDEQGCRLIDGQVHYADETYDSLRDLTHADLMGMPLPRRFGGLNLPTFVSNLAIEIISRADAGLMTIFGLQEIAETIELFANEEQKQEYLPRFARGEVTGAMVLTEPDAGSDLQAVALRATENPNGDGFLLNGVKRFISNGCGEVLLVLARSELRRSGAAGLSMFICEKGPTVKIRRLENKLGIKGSPTCEMQFTDTPAQLVGKRRRGLTHYVMSLMNGARIAIAAQATGIAEAAYRAAIDYADSREQFGRKIKQFAAVRDMLVDMKTMVEASRALNMETCYAVDLDKLLDHKLEHGGCEGEELSQLKERRARYKRLAAMLTPMSKMYATEICQKVTHDSIQVHGGSGYMKDYPVERYYRDARITNIYEGTTQLQVVAAIGGVTSGTFMHYIKQLDQSMPEGVNPEELQIIRDRVARTEETIAHFNQQEEECRDLYAREMVDLCIELILS